MRGPAGPRPTGCGFPTAPILPSIMSRSAGSVLIGTLNCSSARTIGANRRRIGVGNGEEDFLRAVSPQDRSAGRRACRRPARHESAGRPSTVSSSTKPIGIVAVPPRCAFMSRTISSPASPAPKIRTRLPGRRRGSSASRRRLDAHGAEQEHQQHRIDDEHRSRVDGGPSGVCVSRKNSPELTPMPPTSARRSYRPVYRQTPS